MTNADSSALPNWPASVQHPGLSDDALPTGVAIPHARLPDVKRLYGLLARSKEPIEFDAIDGHAADLVFVLLLPAPVESTQLGALALVARTLKSPEVRDGLRRARAASELCSALSERQLYT